ncbi:zf-HC2 domain-containing protein [Streptomyces sp. DSM 15324]|uniref:zf-HC2 domain-containing protein n=1 Tax=Streptomyces sp. DSM 15324 TaxID=1739111 RepID=UPI0007465066|nr:zf-HC2 domain-containing protein [Streptomyces sp. DSM 15324]KUO11616.1 hypothetical protein AQJ58_10590 [Streptomyces sp. DSM 15324]
MTEHPTRSGPPAPRADGGAHLSGPSVAAYALGRLDAGLRDGVEAHLLHCPRCADAVDGAVRQGPYGTRVEALHRAVLDRVGAAPSAASRPAPRRRRTPPPATAPRRTWLPPWVSATQGLRPSWFAAVACVCALSVLFGRLSQSPAPRLLLLLLAPVLPVLCVAGSYGGRADPFAEVTRTTPHGGLRILLQRTAQTLVVCVPLLTGAAALMPRNGLPAYSSAGWLLPCLTVTLATLLLSASLGSWAAALTTGGGWLLLVCVLAQPLLAHSGHGKRESGDRMVHVLEGVQLKLLDMLGTTLFGAASAVLVELLVLRRHSFSRLGAR